MISGCLVTRPGVEGSREGGSDGRTVNVSKEQQDLNNFTSSETRTGSKFGWRLHKANCDLHVWFKIWDG
jgi:hypothetical protein